MTVDLLLIESKDVSTYETQTSVRITLGNGARDTIFEIDMEDANKLHELLGKALGNGNDKP